MQIERGWRFGVKEDHLEVSGCGGFPGRAMLHSIGLF